MEDPRNIAPPVRSTIVLIFLCHRASLHMLQSLVGNFFLYFNVVPVIIVLGLYVFEIPLFGGNALPHKTMYLTSSITIHPGTLVNGSVLYISLMRSFTLIICRSMRGMCSRVGAMFIVIIDKYF